MPELPDVTVYVDRLAARVVGRVLVHLRVLHPFLVRTADPPITAAEGCVLVAVERLAKRVVLVFDDGRADKLYLVIHLMIAGRLKWLKPEQKPPARISLATFAFDDAETAGTLVLTEAGTQRRASLHLVRGRAALQAMDPGGLDVMGASRADFAARLAVENHTVKRALTMPQLFSGIGNAYSDEILHRARLSPLALTRSLDAETVERLHVAARAVLGEWVARLGAEADANGGWPKAVTAFHPQMAVHGRYGQPCPDCGAPVQRIVRADNETDYCARCQTGGRLLADRALSRLLKESWPRSLDELG